MNCPRCNLPLKTQDYEGVETEICEECWGFWLDTGEFENILDRRDFTFSEDEREAILSLRSASKPGESAPAPCPKCGRIMEMALYDESVRLEIDRCVAHGVWLDTGEIKKVQALAEKSPAVHRLLLKKLGFKVEA